MSGVLPNFVYDVRAWRLLAATLVVAPWHGLRVGPRGRVARV